MVVWFEKGEKKCPIFEFRFHFRHILQLSPVKTTTCFRQHNYLFKKLFRLSFATRLLKQNSLKIIS